MSGRGGVEEWSGRRMEGWGGEGVEGRKEWGGKGEYASLALGGWTPLPCKWVKISQLSVLVSPLVHLYILWYNGCKRL